MALYELDGVRPTFPENGQAWVAPSADVIGNVRLMEDASVWFNAVLRGDNEAIAVGTRSNVQENCVFHTDPGFPLTVGANCTIGHKVMLHGCTIGADSLIGMGAIILNGARIGEGCLVGAGALIPEGKEIPAGSVVLGAPGKVVREVTDRDREMIARGVESYCKRWRQFQAGLIAVD